MVGDRGEALLVDAQGEQQVRDAVRRRQLALGGVHAEAVDAAAAGCDQQGTGLADEPDAQLAVLERQAGAALEVARLVVEQVAEESLRDRLGMPVARPLRARDGGAAGRVQLGDDPGVRRRHEGDRRGDRLEPEHPRRGGDERDGVEQRPGVPEPCQRRSQRASVRARHGTVGELRERLACGHSRPRSGGA